MQTLLATRATLVGRAAAPVASTVAAPVARFFSSDSGLKAVLEAQIPEKRAELAAFAEAHGKKEIDKVKVEQVLGGMRSIKSMLWDVSLLDADEGIRFRGMSIPQLQESLPGAIEGGEPQPEGLLWLMLTGEVPTKAQVDALTEELHSRAAIPAEVEAAINAYPKEMHPMTQFASAVLALQPGSKFAQAYADGTKKTEYWDTTYEDVMDLIAKLPRVAALIYRNTFKDGTIADYDSSKDYSGNFAQMLGYDSAEFDELMRLYLTIHTDHEGGNVSAHTSHLVGSALSDPYLSFSASMCGLAGPLHGLANQEVLLWVQDLQKTFADRGVEVTHDSIREFAWETLNAKRVIPGYGHAVLRATDPRYLCQRIFAQKHLPDDPLFKIVSTIYEVVPDVLTEHGKTANPWPNVDAHSGCLLVHYGMDEARYYTVLFGVSRAMGVLSQLFWSRATGLPLERPKSLTLESMKALYE